MLKQFSISKFKTRAKSLDDPRLRHGIYSKIKDGNPNIHNWKNLIRYELDLRDVLNQFNRTQVNSQNNRRNLFRAAFQLRKEITLLVQEDKYEEMFEKLQKLKELLPSEQTALSELSTFFRLRQSLLIRSSNNWLMEDVKQSERLIQYLKTQVSQVSVSLGLIKTKLVLILSLCIIRTRGVLIGHEEQKIVSRAIELKKRKIMVGDRKQEKMQQLEVLLYLLFEQYRILFLTRKEQQLILFHYNEMLAYVELYKRRFNNYREIQQKYCIEKQLLKMKPTLLDLQIYHDSQIRNRLAIRNIHQEIQVQEGELNGNDKYSFMQATKKQDSFKKEGKGLTLAPQKRNLLKLKLKFSSKLQSKNTFNFDQPDKLDCFSVFKPGQFKFKFLVYTTSKLLVGDFEVELQPSSNLIDVAVKVRNHEGYLFVMKLKDIDHRIEPLQGDLLAKFLWRIFMNVFQKNSQFPLTIRDLSNIEVAEQFILEGTDREYQLPILIRIHDALIKLIRMKQIVNDILGPKIPLVVSKLVIVHRSPDEEVNDLDKKKDKQAYQKRKAQIQANRDPEQALRVYSPELKIGFFIRIAMEHLLIRIVFKKHLKLFEIHQMEPGREVRSKQMRTRVDKIKQMQRNTRKKNFVYKLINLLDFPEEIEDTINNMAPSSYSIEEELHLDNIEEQTYQLDCCNLPKKKKIKKSERFQPKDYKLTVKFNQGRYYRVLKRHQFANYQTLSNYEMKIFLPLKEACIPNCYLRLRMYKVPFHFRDNCATAYLLDFKQEPILKSQVIELSLITHAIQRHLKTYLVIQLYSSRDGMFVYEVILVNSVKYLGISRQRLGDIGRLEFNETAKLLGGEIEMKLFSDRKNNQRFSEANQFYTKMFKNASESNRKCY